MPELKKSIGWKYIQDTKFDRQKLHKIRRLNIKPVALYKIYKDVQFIKFSNIIEIKNNLSTTIKNRKSHRDYKKESVTFEELGTILWHSYGIRENVTDFPFRNVPSAGALYPIEIYVYANNIKELKKGVYHFNIMDNGLECLTFGEFGDYLVNACLGQRFVTQAAAVIFFTAFFRRNMSKYGDRGVRYIFLDAGHIAQNMILCCEALGIGACSVGAFFDDEINRLLGIDGEEESIIYLLSIGKKKM